MATQLNTSGKSTPLLLIAVFLCSCVEYEVKDPRHSSAMESKEKMAHEGPVHHGIDYIEFTVTDMAEAKRFYSAAFDWKFNEYGPEYAGIQKEGGEAGGFRLDSKNTTGGPLVVLYSTDLHATLERVREAGGRITTEPFDFPGGSRFHFQDPSGNELAVYASK